MNINGSRATPVLLSQMNSEDLELLAVICTAATQYPNDYSDSVEMMEKILKFYQAVAHELELRDGELEARIAQHIQEVEE